MNDFENELKKQPLRRVPESWRAQIVRGACGDTLKRELQPWWFVLLWPSPRAWGALAAAWVFIICFNVAMREEATPSTATQKAAQIRMATEQKRHLQAEMEEASLHIENDGSKPRSEVAPTREAA